VLAAGSWAAVGATVGCCRAPELFQTGSAVPAAVLSVDVAAATAAAAAACRVRAEQSRWRSGVSVEYY
jgi:hypothetical protein